MHAQVILKRPEEFKIQCLSDLRALWPERHNPFYAGFGNRDSDVVSYREVGVPQSRIMVINPQGEIRHGEGTYCWASYPKLVELSHQMFPFLKPDDERSPDEDEEAYTAFNFWRSSPPPLPEALNDMGSGRGGGGSGGGGSAGGSSSTGTGATPPLQIEPRATERTISMSSMPAVDEID